MNSIIAWFADNKVSANMLMIVLLVGGYLTLERIQKEAIPSVALDQITVLVSYPGASPREVEQSVCIPVESAISSVAGVENIISYSDQSLCTVSVDIAQNESTQTIVEKIKSNLDSITDFPESATRPIVKQLKLKVVAVRILVSGDADHSALKIIAENTRQDLINLGLTSVELNEAKDEQITIEISQANLERYNITFAEIATVIRRNTVSASSGQVNTDAGTFLVSADGKIKTANDLRDIVIRAQPDGATVTLGDIAAVRDTVDDTNTHGYLNGKPAISVVTYQDNRSTVTEISNIVNQYVKNPTRSHPEGITVEVTADAATYFNNRISLLVENAWVGLFFLFVTLTLFLSLRLSFWVSVGIPIAFAGAAIVLYLSGNSINMISTFAFLIVLGIVVDDAIIVGENIFTHQENEPDQSKAAIAATIEIAKPVLFAVMTSIIMFIPLLFFPGSSGKLMQSIPVVVIATLVFSLIECLLILPAHLISKKKNRLRQKSIFDRIQQKFSTLIKTAISKYYSPLLLKVLHWRYAAIAGFIGAFVLSVSLISGGWINVSLFAPIEGDFVNAKVAFPKGTSDKDANETIKYIENSAFEMKEDLAHKFGSPQLKFVHNIISNNNASSITVALADSDTRVLSGQEIVEEWRKRVGILNNVSTLEFHHSLGKTSGPEIDLVLSSNDNNNLDEAVAEVKQLLVQYPGVYQVKDSRGKGVNEIQLQLKSHAYDLGLDLNTLSTQVRHALSGMPIQKLRRSSGEVGVFIRYPEEERGSLWHLENLRIRLADGSHVPLLAVADIYYGTSSSRIEHLNGNRVVRIQAKIDPSISSTGKIWNTLQKDFLNTMPSNYPGMRWNHAGNQLEQQQLSSQMLFYYTIAILVMYMLMAILFKSYSQPLMVMTAIPFGLVGALAGHLLMGYELTIWSMAGMIAVSGIVVNDNFVLIFYINDKLKQNIPLKTAILEAGVARFRPILLTSLTTFAGLLPMLLESSWEAQFLIPMAISISFGVMFATLVSLYLVPALYLALDDVKQLFSRHSARSKPLSPDLFDGFPTDTH